MPELGTNLRRLAAFSLLVVLVGLVGSRIYLGTGQTPDETRENIKDLLIVVLSFCYLFPPRKKSPCEPSE